MTKDVVISFPGDMKVDAHINGFTIKTDQPEKWGGSSSAPAPFELFLGSLGTCAGIYIVFFCQKRGLSYKDIKLVLKSKKNQDTEVIDQFLIEIQLPQVFPDKYRNALIKSVDVCSVKKTIAANPAFIVKTIKPSE